MSTHRKRPAAGETLPLLSTLLLALAFACALCGRAVERDWRQADGDVAQRSPTAENLVEAPHRTIPAASNETRAVTVATEARTRMDAGAAPAAAVAGGFTGGCRASGAPLRPTVHSPPRDPFRSCGYLAAPPTAPPAPAPLA